MKHFIIAGVNKGGTTSLFSYLAGHRRITPSLLKETCFFLPIRYGAPIPKIEEYESCFPTVANGQILMESTPGYFYGGRALAMGIKSNLPDSKIAVVLRDPVDRLFSFFRFMKSMLKIEQGMSLEEYIGNCEALDVIQGKLQENNHFWGVEGGYYANYLSEWFDVFGNDFKVVFFDTLKISPQSVVDELTDWLCIERLELNANNSRVENRTIAFRHRGVHAAALTFNHAGEKIFRQFPNLKSKLREIYFAINETASADKLSDSMRQRLEEKYRDSNRQVAFILRSRGYEQLPRWLASVER